VVKAGAKVVIRLGGKDDPVKLVEVQGMKNKDVVRAVRLVALWKTQLLATWKAIHDE
jgi:hypothetical protein